MTCSGPVLLAIAVAIERDSTCLVSKGHRSGESPERLVNRSPSTTEGRVEGGRSYVAVAFAVVFVVFLLAIDGPGIVFEER